MSEILIPLGIYVAGIFILLVFTKGDGFDGDFTETDLSVISTWPCYLTLYLCTLVIRAWCSILNHFQQEPGR